MIIYKLNGLSKARIWFEHADQLFVKNNDDGFFSNFEISQSKLIKDQTIILELFLPRGGRIIYGALGINYISRNENKLLVKIPATKVDKIKFNESLISSADESYVGLPIEYSKAIYLELARLYEEKLLLLKGELDFFYAAYADVSSSEWIFQKLTYILINLLLSSDHVINEKILANLLSQSQEKIRSRA